jgi:excisionase family DNA binding protein
MAVDALPHSPDGDFQLLTVSEASELIRLPRSSVYELVRNGRIPFVRIGRRLFFVRAALVRWLIEEMSVPPRRREPGGSRRL